MRMKDDAWLQETHEFISKHERFMVGLTPLSVRCHYDVAALLPAHDRVLRPTLEIASSCYVYGLQMDSEVYKQASSILVKDKGKFRVELGQEVLRGYELLWNSHGWARGSVVITIDPALFQAREVFRHCYYADFCENPGSANNRSALRYARNKAKAGELAFCLPASNGLEWMEVFAPSADIHDLFDIACQAALETP